MVVADVILLCVWGAWKAAKNKKAAKNARLLEMIVSTIKMDDLSPQMRDKLRGLGYVLVKEDAEHESLEYKNSAGYLVSEILLKPSCSS